MIKYILNTVFFILSINLLSSQSLDSLNISRLHDTISSKYLNEERTVEIQLPRSYSALEKEYPLVIVFDGDYMFNLVSGNTDYLSFWGNIPEHIVVGINQKNSRFNDTSVFDNVTNLPISSTASFYDFIVLELIPYLKKNYRISKFNIIIGHERTANFANFFILKKNPLIRGVISISPKISNRMNDFLINNLVKTKSKISYILLSSLNDFETIIDNVNKLKKSLSGIKNNNLMFESIILDKDNHYTIPSTALPVALKKLYSLYPEIDKKEYDSIITKLEYSPIAYIENKYKLIKDFYDIDKKISINDFMAIEEYIESFEQFKLYEDLSKLANQEYPGTILPSYYMGRFYEERGNPEKAMLIYRSAYNMNEVEGLTKEYLLELADRINQDFNY
ncbi:MAG: esterase [Flavobacteriaceae bacterium]|nr:esterase [Flavobacteriaceae bacterium]|tara:strand:+ start:2195 stop:3370 length:1176 start_codon:yes stop_codon:yes gene_type:complete